MLPSAPAALRGAAAAWLLIAGALLASPAAAGPPNPPIVAGPGAGFRTKGESMVRSLRAGYSATPILTAGDTLFSNDPGAPPFIFYG
ncbi:MAG: hypothetical protein HY568_02500, partial [Candidatus Latescibacteria bacterium]|nr:hypothetical protein [Candidatus Latescibacterota bacterium]